MLRRRSLAGAFTIAVLLAGPALAMPSFTQLDPRFDGSFPTTLSPDGTLVVGRRQQTGGIGEGVRWTRESGWVQSPGAGQWLLDPIPEQLFRHDSISRTNQLLYFQVGQDPTPALRLAPNGADPSQTVPMPVGCEIDFLNFVEPGAFALAAGGGAVAAETTCGLVRWDAVGGSAFIASGTNPLISDDGGVVAGRSGASPFLWSMEGGLQPLDIELSGGRLQVLSGDGTTLGGVTGPGLPGVFVWDAVHGTTFLDTLPVGGATLIDIASDGSIVVGNSGFDVSERAFVWTRDGGVVLLPERSRAKAMTPDGRWIVGTLFEPSGEQTAFLWDAEFGSLRTLESILTDLGVSGFPFGLGAVYGISDDGTTILGAGKYMGGWVAVIPEPGTAALLALGIAGLATRARRSGRAVQ